MIGLKFWVFFKDKNSTKVPDTAGTAVDGEFKYSVSINNPTVKIADHSTAFTWNYFYIQKFNRYYFVTDVKIEKGFIFITGVCDVLASFKSRILDSSQYVLRSASNYDVSIQDTKYPTTTEIVTIRDYLNLFENTNYTGGSYVIGVANNTGGVGGICYYCTDYSGIRIFMENLMSTTFIDATKRFEFNPIQYITSLKFVPVKLREISNGQQAEDVYIGWLKLGDLKLNRITNFGKWYKEYNLTVQKHPQSEEIAPPVTMYDLTNTAGTVEAMLNKMREWLGYSEADGRYRQIIDIYNNHTPLPQGYTVQYNDEWCDACISAAAIESGCYDLIGQECSVQRHIQIFIDKGIWIEDGTITPLAGDLITFNWDSNTQPNDDVADHIGIVEKVENGQITTIEGNTGNGIVSRNVYAVGNGNIRGYARPNYATETENWIKGNYFLTQTQMENNANIIYRYFKRKNWTDNAIAAILGNMQSESSINPHIWEGLNQGHMAGGYGLTQWTPATKYIDWAGSDWETPERELDRIQYEVDNNQQWFSNPQAPVQDPPITFTEFTQSTLDVATLANYFLWYYEHPAQTIQSWRATQAEAWYTYITSGVIPPQPQPQPTYDNACYLNASPYSQYTLYVPPFGTLAIDADLIKLDTQLTFAVTIDLVSGVALMRAKNSSGIIVGELSTQLCIPIPLTQISQNGLGVLSNILKTAGGVATAVAGAATLNPLMAAGGLGVAAAGIGNTLTTAVPNVSIQNNYGCIAAIQQQGQFENVFRKIVDRDLERFGLPLCQIKQLSELSGYCLCQNAHITISGTAAEQEQIENYLNGGVYLE